MNTKQHNMNGYNKIAGFHTPEFTLTNFAMLREVSPLPWKDTSWHNDTCDSFSADLPDGRSLQLFFPNSLVRADENEEINTFCLTIWTDADQSEPVEYNTIHDVVEAISKL